MARTTDLNARSFSDLLEGEHHMPSNPRERVELLSMLTIAREAVNKAGWHEHTNDWDWRLHVEADGEGFTSDQFGYWADNFSLFYRGAPGDPVPEDYCATVDYERIGYIGVEALGEEDDDEKIVYIAIEKIKKITFERV